MGEKDAKLELQTTEDGNVTGEFKTPMGMAEVKDANIEGNTLTFSATLSNRMTVKVTAEADGDNISGNIKVGPIGKFKFSGARVTA